MELVTTSKTLPRKFSDRVPKINIGAEIQLDQPIQPIDQTRIHTSQSSQKSQQDSRRKSTPSLRDSLQISLHGGVHSSLSDSDPSFSRISPPLSPSHTPRSENFTPRGYKSLKMSIQCLGMESPEFWSAKFKTEFGGRPLFNFWTAEENYAVQSKEKFCLIVDMNPYVEGQFCQPYLFEHSKFLTTVIDICDNKRSTRYSADIIIPINMIAARRYICVNMGGVNYDPILSDVLWFDDRSVATDHINSSLYNSRRAATYILVDLAGLTPFFFTHGCLVDREEKESDNAANAANTTTNTSKKYFSVFAKK
jgi:hypothetical protein